MNDALVFIALCAQAAVGLILMFGGVSWLLISRAREISCRSATGLIIGAGGANLIADALHSIIIQTSGALIAVGVCMLIVRGVMEATASGRVPRRATDWLLMH